MAIKNRKQVYGFTLSKEAAKIVRQESKGKSKSAWIDALILSYGRFQAKRLENLSKRIMEESTTAGKEKN